MFIKLPDWLLGTLRTITIEPVIFFFLIGNFILYGAQIPTNILIYKICHVVLNHTKDTCDNLGDDVNRDIQDDVQIRVNNFQTNSLWISSVPGIIFSLYAGPISDKLGRKPLLMFPIIGVVFTSIVGIINFAFIETLPLEFFYLEGINAFFGGFSIYYLGVYSYGASVSAPEERAHRIARLDGVETIANVVGTLISPVVSKYLSFYGNYGMCGGFSLLAIFYLKVFVKEPIKRAKKTSEEKEESRKTKSEMFNAALVKPLLEMKSLVVKKRKPILAFLIVLQLVIYCAYIIAFNSNSLLYLYMLLTFDGFTSEDFAYFSVALYLGNAFFLVIFMPIVSGRFQLDDALLLLFICIAEVLSYVLSPFITSLPIFYVAQMVSTIGYCKYAVGRSLLTKCCEPEEVGKLFSIQSVTIAITFMISNPIIRNLYNSTLKTFPGAFLLLSASLLLASGFGNFYIYIKRDKLTVSKPEDLPEEVKDKIDYAGADSTTFMTYM